MDDISSIIILVLSTFENYQAKVQEIQNHPQIKNLISTRHHLEEILQIMTQEQLILQLKRGVYSLPESYLEKEDDTKISLTGRQVLQPIDPNIVRQVKHKRKSDIQKDFKDVKDIKKRHSSPITSLEDHVKKFTSDHEIVLRHKI